MNNIKNGQSAAKQILQKPIKGWEDLYEITNDGRIWSIRSHKYLVPKKDKDGYQMITLSNLKQRTYRIHRLVAETFIDNINDCKEVNHKDFNRTNNWFCNLEWVSQEQNDTWNKLHGHHSRYGIQKAYTFTNVYNNNSFTVLGFRNVLQQLGGSKRNFMNMVHKYANTGMYILNGRFKGLRIDSEDLKVQRLENNLVDSSESKCKTPVLGEDIVCSAVKAAAVNNGCTSNAVQRT